MPTKPCATLILCLMRAGQRSGVVATQARRVGLKEWAALVLLSVLGLDHRDGASTHPPCAGLGLSVCQAAIPPPSSNNTSDFLQATSFPHHQLSKINPTSSLNFRERLVTQPWPVRKPPPQALVLASKMNEHVVQGRQIWARLGIAVRKRHLLSLGMEKLTHCISEAAGRPP